MNYKEINKPKCGNHIYTNCLGQIRVTKHAKGILSDAALDFALKHEERHAKDLHYINDVLLLLLVASILLLFFRLYLFAWLDFLILCMIFISRPLISNEGRADGHAAKMLGIKTTTDAINELYEKGIIKDSFLHKLSHGTKEERIREIVKRLQK